MLRLGQRSAAGASRRVGWPHALCRDRLVVVVACAFAISLSLSLSLALASVQLGQPWTGPGSPSLRVGRGTAPSPAPSLAPWSALSASAPLAVPAWLSQRLSLWRGACASPGHSAAEPWCRYLVYAPRRSTGGIGDRLRAIEMLFYVALATDRVLLIAWDEPRPLEETLEPRAYDWSRAVPGLPRGRCECAFHVPVPRSVESSLGSEYVSALLSRSDDHALRSLCVADINMWHVGPEQWGHGLLGPALGGLPMPDVKLLRAWALRALFQASPLLERRVELMLAAAGASAPRPYVAMHVRAGEGAAEGTFWDPPRHNTSTAPAFHDCARAASRQLQQAQLLEDGLAPSAQPQSQTPLPLPLRLPLPLLLVADTAKARGSMAHLLPAPVPIGQLEFHIDRSSPDGPVSPLEGNLDSWASFVVLARAAFIVASESGFSISAVLASLDPGRAARCWALFNRCEEEARRANCAGDSVADLYKPLVTMNRLKRKLAANGITLAELASNHKTLVCDLDPRLPLPEDDFWSTFI
jgi:hypothetical protein